MTQLTRGDLWSLEDYSERRPAFRTQVMAHKKNRHLALGENVRLYFEDELTIRYQIQEMLRIEKTFDAAGIAEELATYNPLIPNGHNWKATLMIEYVDPDVRQQRLREIIGIEHRIWLQVADCDRIFAITDEDLERETTEKTSSVHFMRYELTPIMITRVKQGADISAGIDLDAYRIDGFTIAREIRDSLAADLHGSVVD